MQIVPNVRDYAQGAVKKHDLELAAEWKAKGALVLLELRFHLSKTRMLLCFSIKIKVVGVGVCVYFWVH